MAKQIDGRAKKIITRYEDLKREKYNWNIHYQVLAEYFQTRKADFTVNFTPGTFLNRDLFDSTGPKAGNIMSGALLGMLWPEESQNFEICMARNIPETTANKKFFDEITHRMHDAMTHTECGLSLALNEYMRDEVFFGTSGIGVFEPSDSNVKDNCHFLFQPWDVKRMVIEEGPNGFVNRVFYEREETIEQTILEFGIDAVSEKTRKAYDQGGVNLSNKIRILHAIEPRYNRNPDGVSVFDLPVSSIYVELGENHILKESGYSEMAVFVGRFMKNIRERYGRCPAMDALPDVLELNAQREAMIVATEKMLDPPLGVIDDGRLGAATVDTSAGAINVFNVSGRIGNQPPVFPIVTVGDIKSTKDRIEELKQSVSDHFMIDRLLDMQNDTEMTLGEVLERQKIRAFVLNPLFSRQINEVFTPLINRCFRMLLDKGELGVMPGSEKHLQSVMFGDEVLVIPADVAAAMLRGQEVYDIKYLTPAARMMRTQMASGIFNTWKFANDIAQAQPEIYDNLDEDKSIRLIAEYEGAPREVTRSAENMSNIRSARSKQQQADKQFQNQIETMKAAGHLKGLAQPPGAPGVVNSEMSQPINA